MKEFHYDARHLKLLYKYRTTRTLFMTLFCFVILFQSVSWLVVWMSDGEVSTMDMWFVGVTLAFSLIQFICHTWLYSYNNRIISQIEQVGSAEGFVSKLSVNEKSTFSNMLMILCRIICVLFAVFVGICIFSFIDNFMNWGKILLKIPALVMLLVAFLNLSGVLRFNQLLANQK